MKEFKTIENSSMAEIQEKRSRFIANIFYVDNVKRAEEIIKNIKKKYYDAKHNCYAYIINENGMINKKSSDDGEPNGTAGIPILNVIEKNKIYNVLVLVTRYFGGILLGAGGLVRAYTEVTSKVLKNTNIINMVEGKEIKIIIPYQELEKFKYYCRNKQIGITKIEFFENIMCTIEITNEKEIELKEYIENNDKMIKTIKYTEISKKYIKK